MRKQVWKLLSKGKHKSTLVQVRVDDETKNELEQVLSKLGLNTSQAILLYIKQIILKRKIPFELSADSGLDDRELSPEDFRKLTGYLVGKLDQTQNKKPGN